MKIENESFVLKKLQKKFLMVKLSGTFISKLGASYNIPTHISTFSTVLEVLAIAII